MALKDDILTLKNKEGTLTGNKVCNFAYDDTAFEDDTTTGANGVSVYNYNNHNNIPVKDVSVLKVNPTIISKGFRSQVSTLSRMLLNHIFGRVSYNLNKTVDTLNSLLTNLYTYIGQPNGLATLDNTGRLPYSQLPLSAVEYKGAWNANTNTPTLASGTGTFGDEYIVSTQGTQNLGEGSITYKVGDRVIYNGSIWQRIPASSVRTVNSKTPDANGNVTVNASDMVTPDVRGYDLHSLGNVWYNKNDHYDDSWVLTHGGYSKDLDMFVISTSIVSNEIVDEGLMWSNDGENWTNCTGTAPSHIYNLGFAHSIKYANGMWVACAYGLISWSVDGKVWSDASVYDTNDQIKIPAEITALCHGSIWVAGLKPSSTSGRLSGGIIYSLDGREWQQSNSQGLSDYNIISIAYGNGVFVATRDGHDMMYSLNGRSWVETGAFINGGRVVYANGMFVWGEATSGSYTFWSRDGINWTEALENHGMQAPLSMAYANNRYVVASNSGLFYSDDGDYWEVCRVQSGSSTTAKRDRCVEVVYTNGCWIVGTANDNGLAGTGILKSFDGETYTLATIYNDNHDPACIMLLSSPEIILYGGYHSGGSYPHNFFCTSEGSLTNNVATILDWLLSVVSNLPNS